MPAPDARSTSIRSMTLDDLPDAIATSAAAFSLSLTSPEVRNSWAARVAHPLGTDPDGAFVAERGGRIVGVAQAIRRDRLWNLALLTVEEAARGTSAGRLLFNRALQYAAGETDCGLIISSTDSRALRLYALAGFSLRPVLDVEGTIDRRALRKPAAAVRRGGESDLEALAAISRTVRGGTHTPELRFALDEGQVLLRLADRGFAVVQIEGSRVWMLAASDEAAARELLWAALEILAEPGRACMRWLTAEQEWAIEIALEVGLRPAIGGAVAVLGRPGPLRPFVPSAAFG
jgi:GNAT superfamily N-acetyltransferase